MEETNEPKMETEDEVMKEPTAEEVEKIEAEEGEVEASGSGDIL